MLSNEWTWAIAICVVPFVIFALFELVAARRRKQEIRVARRRKSSNSGGGMRSVAGTGPTDR
jgi:hypothetical protein